MRLEELQSSRTKCANLGQVHDLLHARPRRRLAPRARLLRRARDERVPPYAVGAPEGYVRLAPRRRLNGVPFALQRPLEALLAGETRRIDFAPAASHLGAWT